MPPFFIVGSQRSGTTLLRLILNAHSRIAIPEEGTFWMPLIRSLRGKYGESIPGKSLESYIRYIKRNEQFKTWLMQDLSVFDRLAGRRDVSLRDIMKALYSEYAKEHEKEIWGDKTPSFFRMTGELSNIFPGAKFIHIVRDGRDVYLSMKGMEAGRENIAVAALEWKYKVEKAKRTLSELPADSAIEVRFEDILTGPEQNIRRICNFLGVAFEKGMLDFYKTSRKYIGEHHSDLIFKPINSDTAGKWKKKLTGEENRIFEYVASDCLRKHGYEVFNNGGFGMADRIKAGLLFFGLFRRGMRIFVTAAVLHFSSLLGLRTGAAGGKNRKTKRAGGVFKYKNGLRVFMEKIVDNIRFKSRLKKFDQSVVLLKIKPSDRILDIGVANKEYSPVDNFFIKNFRSRENITALGIGDISEFRRNYPDVRALTYDGGRFPFNDCEFDVAHSNAVIEHVGFHEAQVLFLKEMVRVSKRGMITTPNKYFPVETHTRVPLIHWLEKERFDKIITRMGKGWAAGRYMHLLGEDDLKSLAQKAGLKDYRIIKNRFLGITMTFTLIWFND